MIRHELINKVKLSKQIVTWLLAVVLVLSYCESISAGLTRIKDIARPLGEQVNKLYGHGIVTGLNGTGDGGDAKILLRPYKAMLEKMGNPIDIEDLNNAKNIAYVLVQATLNKNGQSEGDEIDVRISSAYAAKSLAGGTLHVSFLRGSSHLDQTVYASASGPIEIPDPAFPTKGLISKGARVEQDLTHGYITDTENGESTFSLIIDDQIASFGVARIIKSSIDEEFVPVDMIANEEICTVVSPKLIKVTLNAKRTKNPGQFISRVLEMLIPLPDPQATVVINETNRTIAFNSLVEIAPCTIHVDGLNITVVTPEPLVNADNPSVEVHNWAKFNTEETPSERLIHLIDMLKQLGVGFEGQAQAIKGIYDVHCLRAKLIYK